MARDMKQSLGSLLFRGRQAGADWPLGACLQGPAPRGGRAGRRVPRAPSHPLGLASLVELPGLTAAKNKPPGRLLCCARIARTTGPTGLGSSAHGRHPTAGGPPLRKRRGPVAPPSCLLRMPNARLPDGPWQDQHDSGYLPLVAPASLLETCRGFSYLSHLWVTFAQRTRVPACKVRNGFFI